MKNNKKITAASIVISMALCGLSGCSGSENAGSSENISDVSDKASQPDSEVVTEAQSTTEDQPQESQPEAETPAEDERWNPQVTQRQVMTDAGNMCGVAFLGYIDPEADSAACREMFLSSEYAQDFDTLTDIPDENCISTEGGTDLYLIIPADPDCTVTVYRWDMTEENDFIGEAGEVILSSGCGAPFLLKCNRSDIMPDSLVEITNSKGETLLWNPAISLKDGRVAADASGMTVYDFTRYSGDIEAAE